MILLMASSNKKSQARLSCIGFMIYLYVEDDAKETLKHAKNDGDIVLKGLGNDPDKSKLADSMVERI